MNTAADAENASPGIARRRVYWAVLNGTVLVVLAFVLLFTGYLEGGAFVSLLTLALLVGLLTLFGDRVYQVSLFGSEIRLRRLEQEANAAIAGLQQSRIDNYRTSLLLSSQHSNRRSEQGHRDGLAELVIAVVHMIVDAGLTAELAPDIIAACRSAEASVTKQLTQRSEAQPSSEQLLANHDHEKAVRNPQNSDEPDRAVDRLRELVRLRHQAQLHVTATQATDPA